MKIKSNNYFSCISIPFEHYFQWLERMADKGDNSLPYRIVVFIFFCIPFFPAIIFLLLRDHIQYRGWENIYKKQIKNYHLRQKAKKISSRTDAINAINLDHKIFKYLSKYHSDIFIVKRVLRKNTDYIKYTSRDIRDNDEVIQFMVSQFTSKNHGGFKYVSKRLRNDKKIAYKALKYDICNLKFLTPKTKNNRKFLILVLKFNKSHRNWTGFNLSLLPYQLRSDGYLLQLIISRIPSIIFEKEFLKLEKIDLSLYKHAVSINPRIYLNLPSHLRAEKTLLMTAITNASEYLDLSYLIKTAPGMLKNDISIAQATLMKEFRLESTAYQYFTDSVRSNKEICLLAINTDVNNYRYASKHLQTDPEIIDFTYKTSFKFRKKNRPRLNASNIRLLIQNGKSAKIMYKYATAQQRRYKSLYVKALNDEPQLIALETNFNAILKLDFSELKIKARRYCFKHFKKLYSESKKREKLDILEVANLYKQTQKTMLLQKSNMVNTGL